MKTYAIYLPFSYSVKNKSTLPFVCLQTTEAHSSLQYLAEKLHSAETRLLASMGRPSSWDPQQEKHLGSDRRTTIDSRSQMQRSSSCPDFLAIVFSLPYKYTSAPRLSMHYTHTSLLSRLREKQRDLSSLLSVLREHLKMVPGAISTLERKSIDFLQTGSFL